MTVGQIYKVMVWSQAEDGGFVTVVELAAPVEMLVQFAPAAVAAALGTTVQDASFGRRIDPTPEPESDAGQPTRRKRRTKEQIAADEAAAKQAQEMQTALDNGGSITNGPDGTVTVDDPGPRVDKPYSPFD